MADEFAKANHRPVAVLNGAKSPSILRLTAKSGEVVTLSAAGSSDPDGDALTLTWLGYPEAGSFAGEVRLSAAEGDTTSFAAPDVQQPEAIHILLQVQDDGDPNLFAYRRAVVTVTP